LTNARSRPIGHPLSRWSGRCREGGRRSRRASRGHDGEEQPDRAMSLPSFVGGASYTDRGCREPRAQIGFVGPDKSPYGDAQGSGGPHGTPRGHGNRLFRPGVLVTGGRGFFTREGPGCTTASDLRFCSRARSAGTRLYAIHHANAAAPMMVPAREPTTPPTSA